MTRGLEFDVQREFMPDVLKPFMKNGLTYIISDDEVYDYSDNKDCEKRIDEAIRNNDLSGLLELPIYIFYIRIARYKDKPDGNNIDNYEDYLKTNCTGIFLVTDGGEIELYSKNKEEILSLNRYYNNLGISSKYITDENDGRYMFHFWEQ